MNVKSRILSVFTILAVTITCLSAASAESGSDPDTAEVPAVFEFDMSQFTENPSPQEYLVKLFNHDYNTDSYRTLPLTKFDIKRGMIASLTADDPELPDADVYAFPKDGMLLRQYAKNEASYHRAEINVLSDIKPMTLYYVSAQVYDGVPYIAYTAIQEKGDSFFEMTEFFKTKQYKLGNTSHSIELPVNCAEIPVTDELKDSGIIKSFRTDATMPFSKYGCEPVRIHMISIPIPEGKTFEDAILTLFNPSEDDIEELMLYRMYFVKAAGQYPHNRDLRFSAYLFEENGRVEGIVFDFLNSRPNGFDSAVMDFVDYR